MAGSRRLLPLIGMIAVALLLATHAAHAIDLILPTGNDALYHGGDSVFYQRTASSRPAPWQGGRYGFVRNPRQTSEGEIFTRFHDGIDIRPLYRDARGMPLDSVRAVADGRVVHVSAVAGHSNYGKYVVIEHDWDGSPIYSLYAHLNEVWADSGAMVRQGDLVGRLGYTGAGINRARAHLHLEMNLLLNRNFESWYDAHYTRSPNRHGIYNGINMVGIDVARLYLELRDNPRLTLREFLDGEEPFFTVVLPIAGRPEMLDRYPFLQTGHPDTADRSWTIYFTGSGLPLRVEPSILAVDRPTAFVVEASRLPYRYFTKSLLAGHGNNCALSKNGERYVSLMLADVDTYPRKEKIPAIGKKGRDPATKPTGPVEDLDEGEDDGSE